ncbi:PR domain zinc finger protein 12 [Caerostris darwini]|uniref:PR domain zinc finger protein 12 n=1 Tax=Caerostris darwini TaxID=1538125 RepID=A0AAV4PVW5_9ARAC|nr:PR domain zinc finger protein 12 [Caerostris darwini]
MSTAQQLKLIVIYSTDIIRNVPGEVFLDASSLPSKKIGVFANTTIEERTVIGPLPGRLVDSSNFTEKDLEHSWEVVDENGQIKNLLHLEIHGKDSWMCFIQPARHALEQNLETFDAGSAIYYRAIKDINVGEELLVWYGLHIEQCFGLPCFETQNIRKNCLEIPGAVEEEKKKLQCVICHKGFNSRSNLRSHMRTHTQQKPFKCNVCLRRFSQSSTLRNHTRLHTGEKPYKCRTCRSAYSQLAGLRAHQKSSQHQPKTHFPQIQNEK